MFPVRKIFKAGSITKIMEKRGTFFPTGMLLDIIAFTVIIGGALLARFAASEPIAIIGGILASIGIGLLALARWAAK